MGLLLRLRSDPLHRERARRAQVDPIGARFGLRVEALRWVLDERERKIEIDFEHVRPGVLRREPVRGARSTFNEITCQASDRAVLPIVTALAAALGWEIHDPNAETCWRDAGPPTAIEVARFEATASGEPVQWRGEARVDGHRPAAQRLAPQLEHVASLATTSTGWAAAHRTSGASSVELFDAGFTRIGALREGSPPIAISIDGRRIAAAGPQRSGAVTSIRVAPITTLGQAIAWPLSSAFAWLPDWPAALVALTRHPDLCDPISTTLAPEIVAELAALESGRSRRLVVIDTERGDVHALGNDEILGTREHVGGAVAVSGDGEIAIAAVGPFVHGFSLATGKLVWRRRLGGALEGVAVSPCGELAAIASSVESGARPRAVRIVECKSGHVIVSASSALLGTRAGCRALAFHPSGRWLALGLGDGRIVHLWRDGSLLSYSAQPTAIDALAFQGDALFSAGAAGIRRHELLRSERGPALPRPEAGARAKQIARLRLARARFVLAADVDEVLHGFGSAAERAARLLAARHPAKAIASVLAAEPSDVARQAAKLARAKLGAKKKRAR